MRSAFRHARVLPPVIVPILVTAVWRRWSHWARALARGVTDNCPAKDLFDAPDLLRECWPPIRRDEITRKDWLSDQHKRQVRGQMDFQINRHSAVTP